MARESMREILSDADVADGGARPRLVEWSTVEYVRADGSRCVRYHHTDVVAVRRGVVTLDSGGWRTVTTKERINAHNGSGLYVYSDRGEWIVKDCETGAEVAYRDGLRFRLRDRRFVNAPSDSAVRERRRLSRAINAFAAQLRDLERWPTLPEPNGGDCWFCLMFDRVEPREAPRYMYGVGDRTGPAGRGDSSHLLEHVREGYMHGSLILNALRWCGYGETGIAYYWHEDRCRDVVSRAVRRYLRARLGFAN